MSSPLLERPGIPKELMTMKNSQDASLMPNQTFVTAASADDNSVGVDFF